MARWEPAAAVYEVADLFRATCLTTGASLLWPDERAWTVETIDALWDAFMGRPGEGRGSFFEKWRIQLAERSPDVHRLAIDALSLFYLFPTQITYATKVKNVREVLGWKLGYDSVPPRWALLDAAFREGVGSAGPFYVQNLPNGIAYLLSFARSVHERHMVNADEDALVALADETQAVVKNSRAARHVLLHLLFPHRFERIASGDHKRKIVEAFAADASGIDDLDDALLAIRRSIEERTGRPGVDFYSEPELVAIWNPRPTPVENLEIASLRALMERAYPEPAIRRTCLSVLADSIELAHGVSPASWSLNPREGQDNLRLNVGRTQACVLSANTLYLVLSLEALSPELKQRVDAEMAGPDRMGAAYPSAPDAYGAYLPSDRIDELLPLVLDAHHSYVERAAHLTPRTTFQRHHPFAVEYLRQELGRELPDPDYGRSRSLAEGGVEPDQTEDNGLGASSLGDLAEAAHMAEAEVQEIVDLLRDKRQIVLEGPPGSGKTFLADLLARFLAKAPLRGETDERVETVQFHQSYGYEDFVQGIRPVTRDGALHYDVVPGIFSRLCARAAANPDQDFALVVDEINRGNVSRIFGELLMLLEYRDKRVRLPYATGDGDNAYLRIPPNLYLIGTMNSTDRSLAMIDYALRRRFYFYRLLPVGSGRAPVLEGWLARQQVAGDDGARLLRLFVALNRRIEERLSPDFQIGHSYFMRDDIHTEEGLRRVWQHAVMPLLEEYFHGARDRRESLAEFALERLDPDPVPVAGIVAGDV